MGGVELGRESFGKTKREEMSSLDKNWVETGMG
jgi:hypothetical protein